MATYIQPEIIETEGLMEDVFTSSGNPSLTPTPTPYDDWYVTMHYTNFDSGSLTTVAFKIYKRSSGRYEGSKTVTFTTDGFIVADVHVGSNNSPYDANNIYVLGDPKSTTSFQIQRDGNWNGNGDSVEGSFTIWEKDIGTNEQKGIESPSESLSKPVRLTALIQ